VAAGLGVTVRTPEWIGASLTALEPAAAALPSLPSIGLEMLLAQADPPPAVQRMATILRETLNVTLRSGPEPAA